MPGETVSAGDLLVCRVKEITDFGLLLENEDIKDREVFLHVSEIPKERSMQDFKIGQMIVVRVIKISRSGERVFVSLKQLNKAEARSVMRKWRAEKKAVEIFNQVAARFSIPSDVLEDTKERLVEKYGSLTEALRIAIMEGENTLARTKISGDARDAIYELAARELIKKKVKKKMLVRLYFIDKHGLKKLKTVFGEVEKMGTRDVTVEVKVIAAPRYSITLSSSEPKKIKKLSDEIAARLSEIAAREGGILKTLEKT
ncbi:MAG: S1 RNA-binding domain-containing protein [Candidatus Brockarchaeota archaeon]|nr:S1 RNA-binding domain-containing protein [Candidatus Brockarchaeota archaeon]MBO3841850.1 S1 RNA-binding domain-containing protein [Candidatus Brockarchaeota archaeon]